MDSSLPKYLIDDLENVLKKLKFDYRYKLKSKLQEKYNHILSYHQSSNEHFGNNCLVNISHYNLTLAERSLLGKGLN